MQYQKSQRYATDTSQLKKDLLSLLFALLLVLGMAAQIYWRYLQHFEIDLFKPTGRLADFRIENSANTAHACLESNCTYAMQNAIKIAYAKPVHAKLQEPEPLNIAITRERFIRNNWQNELDWYTDSPLNRQKQAYRLAAQMRTSNQDHEEYFDETLMVPELGYIKSVLIAAPNQFVGGRMLTNGDIYKDQQLIQQFHGESGRAALKALNFKFTEIEFQATPKQMNFILSEESYIQPQLNQSVQVRFGKAPYLHLLTGSIHALPQNSESAHLTIAFEESDILTLLRERVKLSQLHNTVVLPFECEISFADTKTGSALRPGFKVAPSAIDKRFKQTLVWVMLDGLAIPVQVEVLAEDSTHVWVRELSGAGDLPISIENWLKLTEMQRKLVYQHYHANSFSLLEKTDIVSQPDRQLSIGKAIRRLT